MPRFTPSVLISDCWGSVGDLTFYHVDGRCYFKKKNQCEFPGTDAQNSQLDVHRRALAAWRTLEHSVQLTWNALAEPVISHKPAWQKFPVHSLDFEDAAVDGTDLRLCFHSYFPETEPAGRYQVLSRIQLTKPGYGRNQGHMRNFLAEAPCDSGDGRVFIVVDDFRRRWDLVLDEYQVHGRYVLLDRQTGYRNIPREFSFSMKLL